MDNITRYVRNIRIETEILEALDWDEDALLSLNEYMEKSFQDAIPMKTIAENVKNTYGAGVWKIIDREIKNELSYIDGIADA
jgi:hypothetical protein